jgi:hypothetical protein
MKGYLTLYSRNRRLTSTLETIQSYIEKRSGAYLSENILAVSYIGTRESVGVGIINPELLSRPTDGGRRLNGEHVANGKSVVVAAGCLGVLMTWRRRRGKRVISCQEKELQVV